MLTSATIDTVHDASGRISAERVADLYGLKLSALAAVLRQSYETLRKNPSRDEAQEGLSKLVHAWNQLETIFLKREYVARWLHHPLADSGLRPLDILSGHDGLGEFTGLAGRIATGTYR